MRSATTSRDYNFGHSTFYIELSPKEANAPPTTFRQVLDRVTHRRRDALQDSSIVSSRVKLPLVSAWFN